jgi:hypothetical protein
MKIIVFWGEMGVVWEKTIDLSEVRLVAIFNVKE